MTTKSVPGYLFRMRPHRDGHWVYWFNSEQRDTKTHNTQPATAFICYSSPAQQHQQQHKQRHHPSHTSSSSIHHPYRYYIIRPYFCDFVFSGIRVRAKASLQYRGRYLMLIQRYTTKTTTNRNNNDDDDNTTAQQRQFPKDLCLCSFFPRRNQDIKIHDWWS